MADDSQRKTPRGCLLAVLVCLGIGGVVCLAGVVLLWVVLPHPDSPAVLQQVVAEGQPIVDAIREYKSSIGLWPLTLSDLPRGSMPTPPPPTWRYKRYSTGCEVQLMRGSPSGFGQVTYRFVGKAIGWSLQNRDYYSPIPTMSTNPRPPAASFRSGWSAAITELRRRIRNEPAEIEHQQGLVLYIMKSGDKASALQSCCEIGRQFPDHWWPAFASAVLEAELHGAESAEKALSAWVEAKPSFVRYWYLARFNLDQERALQALAAFDLAAAFPLDNDAESGFTLDYHLYSAMRTCYRAGRHDIVLRMSDKMGVRAYFEPSYLAIRAASLLSLGRFAEAKSQFETFVKVKEDRAVWADDSDALKQAISARNQSFIFDAGEGCGSTIDVFPEYE